MINRVKRLWWRLLESQWLSYTPSPECLIPPARCGTGSGVEYEEVFPAAMSNVPALVAVDCRPVDFRYAPHARFSSTGMYRINNGVIIPKPAVHLTPGGEVLTGCSRYWPAMHMVKWPRNPRHYSVSRMDGVTLSLHSDYAAANYGHFLMDGIGRLAIATKWDANILGSCDHIVVSGPETGWKRRLLARYGVPMEKVVYLYDSALRCERLLAPSFPGVMTTYPTWLAAYLRTILPANVHDGGGRRRLFLVRRGTSRMLRNQEVLLELAGRFGFEPFVPELSDDPIRAFSESEAVISAHGAGMTDIVFMAPGSRVLELMPDDHTHAYYYTLALAAGLDYSVILGQSESHRDISEWGPSYADFEVAPEALKSYLQSKFHRPSSR